MSDNNTNNTPTPTPRNGLHPMMWVATSAVTVFALAGTAYVTGLLPRHDAEPVPPPAVTAPAPVAEIPAPVAPIAITPAKPAATVKKTERSSQRDNYDNGREYSTRDARRQYNNRDDNVANYPDNGRSYNSNPSGYSQPAICRDCGVIESVRAVTKEGDGSGLGAVAGGVVGGALGNGVGQGTGRDLATIAGVIGGAVLGNKVEKSQRQTVSYHTTVRFEDGNSQTFVTDRESAWRPGDRVKVINGQIIPR